MQYVVSTIWKHPAAMDKDRMLEVVSGINRDVLQPAGLRMILQSDDVRYVQASIRNVWQNLALGALLATLVLYLFLRSLRR